MAWKEPSWLGAMMALINASSDKVKFCKEYEIDIRESDWPCCHVPQMIVADRGEMIGKNAESFANTLNIQIKYAPPYRADWKGIVEQHFRVIQQRVKPFLPGYVDKDFRERGVRDYRLDAKLDIYQFTQIIIKCIIYHNTKHFLTTYSRDEMMVADEVKPVPVELWKWGIANRSGSLRYYPEDIVKLSLMPKDTARVTHKGIIYKKLHYSCDKAIREMWFDRARRKTWKVDISYDPRNLNSIYIRDTEDQTFYEKCYLLDSQSRYFEKTLDEIKYLMEYEKLEEQKSAYINLQSESDLKSDIESIVRQAEDMTKMVSSNTVSNSSKVKGIQKNRQVEKEINREKEAFELGKNEPSKNKSISNKDKMKTDNDARFELLKRKQRERMHGKGEQTTTD
ncbi:Mu transposase C-terminal domain-containing protein [Desulforamulus aeronauticus]|nr:Mu transposase C-terminal domain-containing protein [Desulforamulus aeronauticus]